MAGPVVVGLHLVLADLLLQLVLELVLELVRERGRLLSLLLAEALVLEQAVDLEPVRAAPVPGAALGHADREALLEPARLARGSILLVDDALVVVLALADTRTVVVGAAEERLAALAGEGAKMIAGGDLAADPATLVHLLLVLLRSGVEWMLLVGELNLLCGGANARERTLANLGEFGRTVPKRTEFSRTEPN